MPTVDEITKERGATYGPFGEHAYKSQMMKSQFDFSKLDLTDLDADAQAAVQEGIEMICHKLARLANGDITHLDSFDDIAGYAKITAREIRRSRGEKVEY